MEKTANKKYSHSKETWRRFCRNKLAVFGLIVFCVILLLAIFADVIAPNGIELQMNMSEQLQPPSAAHLFGTDNFGRDVFARIVHGARYSLVVGLAAVIIGITLGGILGAVAGFFGGIVDSVIMRVMDTLMCIPYMLLVLSVVAALGAELKNVVIAIVISMIPIYTRVIRSSVLTVVGMDYIEAARSCGTPDRFIILRHVLPNAIGPVIVQATMSVGTTIISAASTSFLGMGIQPPTPEWGAMLSESKNFIATAPYLVLFPGLFIGFTVLALNLMGDGLRDALDPKLKD